MRILKTRSIIRQLLPTTSQILITSKFLIFSIRITHSYITISRATPLKFSFDLSRERYNSAQTRPPSVNGNIKKTWKRGEKLIVLPRCLQPPPPHPPFTFLPGQINGQIPWYNRDTRATKIGRHCRKNRISFRKVRAQTNYRTTRTPL